MRHISKIWKWLTTRRRQRLLLRLAVMCLMIFTTFASTPTCSYATVMQSGPNQVTMSGTDLQKLISDYVRFRADAQVSKSIIESERQAHMEYTAYVGTLLQRQQEERAAYDKIIKTLERQLNGPQIELYGGYNTSDQWEGGIRLVLKIR